MAQYHVTIDSELLQHLFLSDARDSSVSKLLESILNQILEVQATEQLRAALYERTQERQGYRNGTYPHTLTTRVGSMCSTLDATPKAVQSEVKANVQAILRAPDMDVYRTTIG